MNSSTAIATDNVVAATAPTVDSASVARSCCAPSPILGAPRDRQGIRRADERKGRAADRRAQAGYYTRIGAAIRHAASGLAAQPQRKKLLIVLADGKANDVDHYEGRFAVEDRRKAVQEARRFGPTIFGVDRNYLWSGH